EHPRGVADLLEARAHHLRLATQAVGILHARIVLEVRAADLTSIEQREVMLGRIALTGMPAQLVDAGIERGVTAGRGVHGERAGGNCSGEDVLGSEEASERERRRDLRAVEERQSFLRRQLDRLRMLDLA